MTLRGIIDYLEVLQIAGVSDWGPFRISDEERETFRQRLGPASEVPAPPSQKISQPIATPNSDMSKRTTAAPEKDLSINDRAAELAQIAAEVAKCRKCKELAATRTQTVFGVGNPAARLVFLGEAPGADEDRQGIPFVGRAGQLLTDMIVKGMKLKREEIYICNVLRCRPPGNRNPEKTEAENCRPFLDRTLAVIRPEFICCLGAIAAQNLLGTEETIGWLRGTVHSFQGMKVVCTYHPAYLLRNPSAKAKTWEDLQLLMREMGLPVPKK